MKRCEWGKLDVAVAGSGHGRWMSQVQRTSFFAILSGTESDVDGFVGAINGYEARSMAMNEIKQGDAVNTRVRQAILFSLMVVMSAAGCVSSDPVVDNDAESQSEETAQIDEFSIVPELAAVDQDVEFAWSISGDVEDCELDVTGDGSADYESDDCDGAGQFEYAYGAEGTYDVAFRATVAGGEEVLESGGSVEVVEGEAPEFKSDFEHYRIIRNSIAGPVEISESFVIEGTNVTATDELEVDVSPSDNELIDRDDIDVECDEAGECDISFEVPRAGEHSFQLLITVADDAGFSSGASLSVSVEPRWVMSPDNVGTATLREKISMADDGDYIGFNFDGSATISLMAAIDVDTDVHIIGPGRDDLTIDGQHEDRIATVGEGTEVQITDLTMRRGEAPEDEGGGAIYNEGTVVMSSVTIEDSRAIGERGGAVYNGDVMDVEQTIFRNNESTFGGAIRNVANFYADETLFVDNFANATGGAIYQGGGLADDSELNISNSAFISNHARNHGGGILNDDSDGKVPMTIYNTTFADNSVTNSGGGIYNMGQMDLSFVSVVDNHVFDEDGVSSFLEAGGIRNRGPMRMKASVVANNTAPNGEVDVSGEVSSLGFNIIGDSDGFEGTGGEAPFVESDVSDTGPVDGELDDTGAWDASWLPDAASPGVDHIPEEDCFPIGGSTLNRDQRGESRPAGENCDSGAVERQ